MRKQRYLNRRVAPEKHCNRFRFKNKLLTISISSSPRHNPYSESNNSIYALKTIDLKRVPEYFKEELKNEIEVLKTLDHPNIIRAYETYEKKNHLSLVMQLCTGGDLYTR